MKNLVVFYLDVGNASPTITKSLVKKMKDEYKESINRLKLEGNECIVVPVPSSILPGMQSFTRVEVLSLNSKQ